MPALPSPTLVIPSRKREASGSLSVKWGYTVTPRNDSMSQPDVGNVLGDPWWVLPWLWAGGAAPHSCLWVSRRPPQAVF